MKAKQLLLLGCALFMGKAASAQTLLNKGNDNGIKISDFPRAKENQKQIVINLPAKETLKAERDYKVELLPGKTMTVDCNLHGLNGMLEAEELKGFGINYYIFKTNGNVSSTQMGCPANSNHEEFVTAKSTLMDYSSRAPIVIYVPAGYDVKYRIWTAGKVMDAEQPTDNKATNSEALYQTWEWVSSEGGYAGGKTSLNNTGMSKVYSFKKDGSYSYYKNGKMAPAGKFNLSNDVSIFIKGKAPMIKLGNSDRKMSYTFKDKNTLILQEECYDCYKHTYRLKTGR